MYGVIVKNAVEVETAVKVPVVTTVVGVVIGGAAFKVMTFACSVEVTSMFFGEATYPN